MILILILFLQLFLVLLWIEKRMRHNNLHVHCLSRSDVYKYCCYICKFKSYVKNLKFLKKKTTIVSFYCKSFFLCNFVPDSVDVFRYARTLRMFNVNYNNIGMESHYIQTSYNKIPSDPISSACLHSYFILLCFKEDDFVKKIDL